MTDTELERLTLKELRDLKVEIEDAIRAAIRAKNAAKNGIPQPGAPQPSVPTIDLERERDMWLTARGSKQPA